MIFNALPPYYIVGRLALLKNFATFVEQKNNDL